MSPLMLALAVAAPPPVVTAPVALPAPTVIVSRSGRSETPRLVVAVEASLDGASLYHGTLRVGRTGARFSQQESQASEPGCGTEGERRSPIDDTRRDFSVSLAAMPGYRSGSSGTAGMLIVEASLTRPAIRACQGSRTVSLRSAASICERKPILLAADGGLAVQVRILSVTGAPGSEQLCPAP